MIAYKRYLVKQIDKEGKTPLKETILEAKLRFNNEREIKDTIYGKVYGQNQEPGLLSEFPFEDYLYKSENITYNILNKKYRDCGPKDRKIKIKKKQKKLGLDIRITCSDTLSESEMFNLEGLNKFILEYCSNDCE
jgi:hypothetical protein